MKYWLESLAENGFDVFTVVYMAVLFIIYHYLTRWFFNIKISNLEQKVNVTNDILWRLEEPINQIQYQYEEEKLIKEEMLLNTKNKIEVTIYYTVCKETSKKVYDLEAMTDEFEDKLNQLMDMTGVTIMCSVKED